MFKEYFIYRNGKQYRVSVTAERMFPSLRVQLDVKTPLRWVPNCSVWKPVGPGARSEWLSETESVAEQVDRMIEKIFAEAKQEEKEKSELEKYFSKTP